MTPTWRGKLILLTCGSLLLAGCVRRVPSKIPLSDDDCQRFAVEYCRLYNQEDIDAFLGLHDTTDALERRAQIYKGTLQDALKKMLGLH
ncbi:MAG: hypothetical protein AB7K24_29205, partial [Gemmataceae bacterium]